MKADGWTPPSFLPLCLGNAQMKDDEWLSLLW